MKHFLITLSFLALASPFANAQDKKNTDSISVKPLTLEVSGGLSDYFEVINKAYKIPNDGTSKILTVELKRKDKNFDFNIEKASPFEAPQQDSEYNFSFLLNVIYVESHVVTSDPLNGGGSLISPYNYEDAFSLLRLKKGEKASIKWKIDDIHGIKAFELKSILRQKK